MVQWFNGSFLQRMAAYGGHARLRSVAFNLIRNSRRVAGLRVDQLHIRNIQPGFPVDDSATAIAGRFLMPLYHGRAFNLHFAARGRNRQHATSFALIAAGDHYHLIVLSDFGSSGSFQ
jgi:hypothetical protein